MHKATVLHRTEASSYLKSRQCHFGKTLDKTKAAAAILGSAACTPYKKQPKLSLGALQPAGYSFYFLSNNCKHIFKEELESNSTKLINFKYPQ